MIPRIPLSTWAKRAFPEGTPHPATLRRWIKRSNIDPPPVKVGKVYYVEPHAEYITEDMIKARLLDRIA